MLNLEDLHRLVQAAARTRESEIGCDQCFARMDRFVEIEISGSDATAAMPQVHHHLRNCEDCRDKYEALLAAIVVP